MLRSSLLSLKRLIPTKAVSNSYPEFTSLATRRPWPSPPRAPFLKQIPSKNFSLSPESVFLASIYDYKTGLGLPHLDDRLENEESIDKLTSKKSSVSSYNDYDLCLKHEPGDFDPIPEDLQMKIRDFADNTFIPDVLHYLGTKDPVYRKYSVYQVELHGYEYKYGKLKGLITNEERYDLFQLEDIFELPYAEFTKIEGKRLVGSAIRICKAIGKPEHADVFKQIIEGCFNPDEYQDPKDRTRFYFDLHVEPSTGGIQCNCCHNKK